MCIYSHFQYLCLHEKLKIIRACSKAFKDSQGVLTCPDAPNLQANDNTHRTFGHRTYGVGVCSSIHCAWSHGILPCGDFGNNKRFGKSTSFEDDTEIEDSPTLREERVSCWFRLLDADQQLDHCKTEYPLPEHELSPAGRALLRFPSGAGVIDSVDTLRWQELNPLYLTPAMLQWCVLYRLLPANIADNRKSKTITPHKPVLGPFRPQGFHTCPKSRGICRVCGENIGSEKLKQKTLSYRQNMALIALLEETCVQADPKGTVWDPSIKLEWDDNTGKYRKIQTNFPVYDAPYPASSNPAFVPSTTQAVETAAVFARQVVPLADGGNYASTDSGLTAGMDWEHFVMDDKLDKEFSAVLDAHHWPTSDFLYTTSLPTMPQTDSDMNKNFSYDTGALFGAGTDTSFNADTGKHSGLPGSQFNTFTHAQPSQFNTTTYQYPTSQSQLTNQVPTSQYTSLPFGSSMNQSDQMFQLPNVQSRVFDDPMITCDAGEDLSSSAPPVSGFSAEQKSTADQARDDFSPETLELTREMLRQASNGGVARPSDDPAANALFEQVLQFRRAGLV